MPHVLFRGLWDFQVILVSTTFLDHIFWRIGTVIIKLKKQAKSKTLHKIKDRISNEYKNGKEYAKLIKSPPKKSSVQSAQFSRHNTQKDFRKWWFYLSCLTCFRPLKLSQKVWPQLWNPEQPPCDPSAKNLDPASTKCWGVPDSSSSSFCSFNCQIPRVAEKTALKPIENGP